MTCPLRRLCGFGTMAAAMIPGYIMGSQPFKLPAGSSHRQKTGSIIGRCFQSGVRFKVARTCPVSQPHVVSNHSATWAADRKSVTTCSDNISKFGTPLACYCHKKDAAAISVAGQATGFHAAYAEERAKEWLMALDVESREHAGLGQAEFGPLWKEGPHQAMATVVLVHRNYLRATPGSHTSAENFFLFLCVAAASQRNNGPRTMSKSRSQHCCVRWVVQDEIPSKQQGVNPKSASAAAVQVSTPQTGKAEFESVSIPGLASLELLVSVVEAAPVMILQQQTGSDSGGSRLSSLLSIEVLDDATGSVLSALTMDLGKLWEPNPSPACAGCQEDGIQQQMQVHSLEAEAAVCAVKNQAKRAEPPPPRRYTDLFQDWALQPVTLSPIGHVLSRFKERHGTPRQAVLADDNCSEADAELVLDLEFVPGRALEALEGFDYAWLLTDLHLNRVGNPHASGGHWNPMVRAPPPRRQGATASTEEDTKSDSPSRSALSAVRSSRRTHERRQRKVGVLATRAPHRPNPIGLSAVRVVGVDCKQGRVMLRGVDLLDGTPVLDIKPYIPYADAFPNARAGWLDEDK